MASNRILKKLKYAMRYIPDKAYIQIYYFAHFKKFCNLKNPRTYNEKLNWLKLHDHNPLYTRIVDKYEVKQYVAEILGGYLIPTLGVWDSFKDINFDYLPNQFVLKCTHDSEGNVIVKNKLEFDVNAAREKIERSLQQNFYYYGREWPYKDVKPRIIAETYMEDSADGELKDYKFFCFNGIPKLMQINSKRNTGHQKVDFYDMEFNHLDMKGKAPNSDILLRKPKNFEKMIELAKILSDGFIHVRVDFYEVNGNVYFGELTFYHHSGFMPFKPEKWDYILGEWLVLPDLYL